MGSGWRGKFYSASREALLVEDPEVIFTVGPPEGFLDDPAWQGCSAVRSGAIYQVDPSLLNRPGPRLAQGVRLLTDLLDRRRPR
jgi:iron complex transport system substrate-binding protein